MTPLDYIELVRSFAAELVLAVAAGVILFLDLRGWLGKTVTERAARGTGLTILGLSLGLAIRFMFPQLADAPEQAFVLGPTTLWLQTALLLLAALSLVAVPANDFTEHVGEFYALFLLATVGLLLMVGTENLLVLFVALELSSLSLYAMTALHQRRPTATEAALKYFLLGGTAAALALFGMSLLYGLTGAVRFAPVAARVSTVSGDPLFWLAVLLTLAGFGFKTAVVPFHAWAPDVYQSAPGPVAALVASGSKLAGFFALYRLLEVGLAPAGGRAAWLDFQPGWLPVISMLALASMLLGNLAALAQTSLRRLMAWSAIAQAGYALVGLTGPSTDTPRALGYFAFTYGLAVIGVFGVLAVLDAAGESDGFESLHGLWRRSPLLTVCLSVFVLSLAGLPPFAGFFGKLFLFIAAAKRGGDLQLLWLVIAALGLSVVSLYYYLRILKPALIEEPPPAAGPIVVSVPSACSLVGLAVSLFLLGCAPAWLFTGVGW